MEIFFNEILSKKYDFVKKRWCHTYTRIILIKMDTRATHRLYSCICGVFYSASFFVFSQSAVSEK
jgi:hypothetical protein